MQPTGSTFIVTGGASGLGEGTARMLVAGGANVVIADVQADKGEALVAELGKGTRFAKTDVTAEADGRAAVELALKEFGALAGPGQLRRHRHRRAHGQEGRAARARLFYPRDHDQPGRHLQHDPPRRGGDDQGSAERGAASAA